MALIFLAFSVLMMFCPILLPWSLDSVPMFALFMILGYQFRRLESKLVYTYRIGMMLICIVIYGVLVAVNPGINLSIRSYGIYPSAVIRILFCYMICITGSIIYINIFQFLCTRWKCICLVWIGKHTLAFLCTQLVAIGMLENLVGRFSLGSICSEILIIIGTIILCTIFCIILELIIKVYPKLSILIQFRYKLLIYSGLIFDIQSK